MFGWIGWWWRRGQRAIDIQILWPVMKEYAIDIDQARAAFMLHCVDDGAWMWDYDLDEIKKIVWELN